jgi:hypothetical protein
MVAQLRWTHQTRYRGRDNSGVAVIALALQGLAVIAKKRVPDKTLPDRMIAGTEGFLRCASFT